MESASTYKAIGLMSGTSGDGLDIAYCHFSFDNHWRYSIEKASTLPFPSALLQKLSSSHLMTGEALSFLDVEFGTWMGKAVREFCDQHQLEPDIVASHGHTVFHRPDHGLTKQIGAGWPLRQQGGIPVINDFRSLDVALGGQGAPLAPIGDHYLFPAYDFCLNLGGISNISMLHNGQRIAFDISPFNLLLNPLAQRKGLAYDDGGKLASKGQVISTLLTALNEQPFYSQRGAKSLGRENIEQDFLPLLQSQKASVEDLLRTLVEHYAVQIADVVLAYGTAEKGKLLVTGGGAYHAFFIQTLQDKLGDKVTVIVPPSDLVEFKEALIFAFLGVLRWRGEPNSMASVTGASCDSCGGVLFP